MSEEGRARERIESVRKAKEAVVQLAELASLAVQVDAGLLRRLRQELVTGVDPGLESDLWFSPLVESQDLEACVFHPAVTLALREDLRARGPGVIEHVARLMAEAHAHLPAAIRLEEELTGLAMTEAPEAAMERALQPALRTLLDPDEARSLEVARWVMHAAPRFPERLRSLPSAQALVLGAALRLEQPFAGAVEPSPLPVEDLSWLLPDPSGERMRLGVALLSNGLRFEAPGNEQPTVELPKTNPALVSLRWQQGGTPQRRLVHAAPGVFVGIPSRPPEIEIVTLARDVYVLAEAAQTVSPAVAATPVEVPEAFLRSCLLVENLGSTASPGVAFPVGDGLWVTTSRAVGHVPFVGTLSGPALDQFAVVNADDTAAEVLVLRALESRRAELILPLAPPPADPGAERWQVVGFLDESAQSIRALPRPRVTPEARTLLVDVARRKLRYLGAPVVRQGSVVGMVVAVKELPRSTVARPRVILEVLPGDAVRAALFEPAHTPYRDPADDAPASAVTSAQFVPGDARHLVIGTGDGVIRVYDGKSGLLSVDMQAHAGAVRALAFPQSRGWFLVSGSNDGTVKAWDLVKDEPSPIYSGRSPVSALAAVPGTHRLVVGTADGTVRFIEADRTTREEKRHVGAVRALAVDSRGRAVSGGSDGFLFVWEDPDGHRRLQGHTGGVLAVALTPDGRFAVSGSEDNTIRVWDIETARERHVLRGPQSSVRAVAVTPDGERIVSGSTDGSVRVWHLESGQLLTTVSGRPGAVFSMGLSSDGERVVAGAANGVVRIWDLASSRLLREFQAGPPRVFISYAAASLQLAEEIATALQAKGIGCYLPRTDSQPGDPPSRNIARVIGGSELVLAVVTREAMQQPWLRGEVEHALSLNKRVLPVTFGPVKLERALPRALRSVKPYDLTTIRKGGSTGGLVALVERLLATGGHEDEAAAAPRRSSPRRPSGSSARRPSTASARQPSASSARRRSGKQSPRRKPRSTSSNKKKK